MAGKPTRLAAEPKPEPIKTKIALKRLADLAVRPAAPERMCSEVEGMVKDWRADTTSDRRIQLREALGEMEEELRAGIEAAGNMMDEVDADNAAAKRHGDSALAAPKAPCEALVSAGRGL